MDLTIREKVLLHLKNHTRNPQRKVAPREVSQSGIADRVGGSRSHLSRVLRSMVNDGLVKEQRKYLENDRNRKRKVYFLTSKGIKEEERLREELQKKKISLKTSEMTEEIELEELKEKAELDDPILFASVNVDEDGVLDLVETKKKDVFIDRESEMKRLKEVIDEVKKEGSSTFLLAGEAGTGKTTLAMEFKKHAEKKGFDFFTGKSYSEKEEPYLPLKKAFEQYENQESSKLISILSFDSSKEEKEFEDIDAERHSVYFEFTDRVKKLAENNPSVIFLDDLQWADHATINLLNYLIDNITDSPILFLGAYRSEEIKEDHLVNELKRKLSRTRDYEEMEIKPLELKDTRKMLRSILPGKKVPKRFVEFIHDMTEGNPLFVKEFLTHLKEEEKLPEDLNEYTADKEKVDLPRLIEELLKQRFKSGLGKEAKKLASLGSVIGEEFSFGLLHTCSDKDDMELLDTIDDLLDNGIWEEISEDDGFRFSHRLLWRVIYDDMSSIKQKKLHERVAECIKHLYSENLKDHHSDLGYHYQEGGKIEKAADHYFKAGVEAERVYAHDNAKNMYGKALKLSQNGIKAKILERLGEIDKISGEYENAIVYFERAIDETKDEDFEQKLLGKLCEAHTKQSQFEEALKKADEGLKIKGKDCPSKSKLLHAKGWVHFRKGDYKRARDTFEEERRVAERIEDKNEIAQALHNIGTVDLQEGHYDRAKDLMEKVVRMRKKDGPKIELARSMNNLGNIQYLIGNLEDALKKYKESLQIRQKIDDKSGIASSFNNLAVISMKKGELEKALEYNEKSLQIKRQIGDRSGIIESLNNMGIIYENKGDLDSALDHYKGSLDIGKKIGDKSNMATSLNNIGNIYYQKGELEKSLDYYQRSLEINKIIGEKLASIPPRYGLAEVYIELGDEEKAVSYAEEAVDLSQEIGAESKKSTAYRILGKVYRESGRLEKACESIERSLQVVDETEDDADYWKSIYEKGLLHKKRGEKERADELLNSSLEYFEKRDMDLWCKRCEEVIDDP